MVCGTAVPCGTALTLEVGEPIGTALMLGCATLGCEVFETIWYPASDTSPPTMPAINKPRNPQAPIDHLTILRRKRAALANRPPEFRTHARVDYSSASSPPAITGP